jgi:hypothetical protein
MDTCNRYDDLRWLSYARGRLDSDVAADMKLHQESCKECARRLEFSRKIAAIIELNASEPPESWTDEAVAEFDGADLSRESSHIFGNLVFDSYVHEMEAVRSRSLETRHLVFELPGFELDLSLEYSGRQINTIMGHLVAKSEQSSSMSPVFSLELLVADRSYSTTPNPFGEFSFSVKAQLTGEPLELRCAFEEGPCAVVLIPC